MERLVITIHPAKSDDEPLRVEDAMRQVIDILRLHSEARKAVPRPEEGFDWKLESASTNSPFTVTARADPTIPGADVTSYVREVTEAWSTAMTDLTRRGVPAWWMDVDDLMTCAEMFRRNRNGIGLTQVVLADAPAVTIDKDAAANGLQAVTTVDALALEESTGESVAWGETVGVMDTAGRHYGRPALRLITADYGLVWCRITPEVAGPFGRETTLEDTWKGKQVVVEGRFIYKSGRLSRIIATGIRPYQGPPPVDLDAVRDLGFTDGLDPVEYLRRLHEGDLG
jgi:hypothetical protein